VDEPVSRRQSLLAVADQGLWALTNFSLVVSLAHIASREEFGRLGIGLSAAILLSGLASCKGGETLAVSRGVFIRSQPRSGPEVDGALSGLTGRAVGSIMVIGVTTPPLVLGVVAAVGQDWRSPPLILLGAAAGFAVVAEGLRAVLYAIRRPDLAKQLAAAWLLVQGLLMAAAWLTGRLTVSAAVAAWGVGAVVAVTAALVMHPVKPAFRGATAEEWRRNRRYGFEFLATAGPAQALVPLAGLLMGLSSAAVLRALQSLYGPLNIVMQGVANHVIPAKAHDPRRVPRIGAGVAVIATAVAALATALLMVPGLGQLLLGRSWPERASLVVAYGAGRCAQAVIFGALVIYRAHDAYRLSSPLRFATALVTVGAFTTAASRGLLTAVWASSLGFVCLAAAWWAFPLHLARSEASDPQHRLAVHRARRART